VGDQRNVPAVLPPGKTRHSFYKRLGGHQGRYELVWDISPLPGFDPRTVQTLAFAIPTELSRPIPEKRKYNISSAINSFSTFLKFPGTFLNSVSLFFGERSITYVRLKVGNHVLGSTGS
jgi:hypothetical protein